jgi:hypothetical protein
MFNGEFTAMKTSPTVLAVGATGQFAGLVVPELAKRGARVRALIRDARQSDAVRKNGAAGVAVGDLSLRAGGVSRLNATPSCRLRLARALGVSTECGIFVLDWAGAEPAYHPNVIGSRTAAVEWMPVRVVKGRLFSKSYAHPCQFTSVSSQSRVRGALRSMERAPPEKRPQTADALSLASG